MRAAEHAERRGQSSAVTRLPARGDRRSRPLLLLERTMYRDGRTPFTSLFTIKLRGELVEGRLRQALACVQAKHPLLRCVIEDVATLPRFVLRDRPAPIQLRIAQRSGDDDWQAEARREWAMPFEGEREPLVRLVWVHGRGVSELVLAAHHCICDGQAGIALLRDLLSAYDEPEKDIGAYGALGRIEDIVPAAVLESRRFQRRLRWRERMLRLTLRLKGLGGGDSAHPRIPTEQMYFHRWNLAAQSAVSLTERCRSENVTVLAAASLCFMQAFRDVRGTGGLNKVNAMVDARKFLPQMESDALFGLAPGVALLTKNLPRPADMSIDSFWVRARAIKADLMRRIDRLGANLYGNLAGFERLHDKYSGIVDFFERPPAVRPLTFSNMGRVNMPQQYRSFRLEKVYSPLVMVSPTPANTVVISSFAGETEFAIVSDERSLPRAEALMIKDRAMDTLHACLGLPREDEVQHKEDASARHAGTA
jgi:hypothetical protein